MIIFASGGLGLLQMVSEPDTWQCASKDTWLSRGWIVRSDISWRGERNIPYKSVETSPQQTHFKILRGSPEGKAKKMTIFASGRLGRLQMISELDTKQCASEDTGPSRGWIVRSDIGWREKRNISYKGVETSPYQMRFKMFKESDLLAVGLDYSTFLFTKSL